MNCLAIAGMVLRLASTEHGASQAVLVQTECGIEAGAALREGRVAAEAGLRLALPGTPFFVRAGVQAGREHIPLPAPVIIQHGPGIHTQNYSTQLEPIGGPRQRWALRGQFTAGLALPLARRSAVLVEVDPIRGDALLSLRIKLKGGS